MSASPDVDDELFWDLAEPMIGLWKQLLDEGFEFVS